VKILETHTIQKAVSSPGREATANGVKARPGMFAVKPGKYSCKILK